jgi:hypothetical protein
MVPAPRRRDSQRFQIFLAPSRYSWRLSKLLVIPSGIDQVPFYLLICGSPRAVPWEIQFRLNLSRAVGRLDLSQEGLDHHVTSLLSESRESAANPLNTVVWATSSDWVTKVMTAAVAEPLCSSFQADTHLRQGAQCLLGDEATVEASQSARPTMPGLYSHHWSWLHGFDATWAWRTTRGPGRCFARPVDADPVLNEWQPDGAIWLGLACCSAGARSRNSLHGLLPLTSAQHDTLDRVASEHGPAVAPLHRALLGAAKPLRAFIGHVEPIFNRIWYRGGSHMRLSRHFTGIYIGRSQNPLGGA